MRICVFVCELTKSQPQSLTWRQAARSVVIAIFSAKKRGSGQGMQGHDSNTQM